MQDIVLDRNERSLRVEFCRLGEGLRGLEGKAEHGDEYHAGKASHDQIPENPTISHSRQNFGCACPGPARIFHGWLTAQIMLVLFSLVITSTDRNSQAEPDCSYDNNEKEKNDEERDDAIAAPWLLGNRGNGARLRTVLQGRLLRAAGVVDRS
jgi:hypothetical protein